MSFSNIDVYMDLNFIEILVLMKIFITTSGKKVTDSSLSTSDIESLSIMDN